MVINSEISKNDNGLWNLPVQHATAYWRGKDVREWKLSDTVKALHLLHYDANRVTAFMKVTRSDKTVQYGFFSGDQIDTDFLPMADDDPRRNDLEAFIRDYKRRN